MYCDLSVVPEKAIDIGFLLTKLKADGYETFALDYEFKDDKIFKANVLKNIIRINSHQK